MLTLFFLSCPFLVVNTLLIICCTLKHFLFSCRKQLMDECKLLTMKLVGIKLLTELLFIVRLASFSSSVNKTSTHEDPEYDLTHYGSPICIAQWLEHPTGIWKVMGSTLTRGGGAFFFFWAKNIDPLSPDLFPVMPLGKIGRKSALTPQVTNVTLDFIKWWSTKLRNMKYGVIQIYFLVPDYLRTKYDPEIEESEQKLEIMATNIPPDQAQVNYSILTTEF